MVAAWFLKEWLEADRLAEAGDGLGKLEVHGCVPVAHLGQRGHVRLQRYVNAVTPQTRVALGLVQCCHGIKL